MTRRACLAVLAAVPLAAQDVQGSAASLKLLTGIAEALSENNISEALHYFDRNMPGFDALATNLNALSAQYLIACSIEFLESNPAPGDAETLQLDWFLQLRSKAQDGPLVRRRERVTLTVAGGRHPRITAFAPLSLLTP